MAYKHHTCEWSFFKQEGAFIFALHIINMYEFGLKNRPHTKSVATLYLKNFYAKSTLIFNAIMKSTGNSIFIVIRQYCLLYGMKIALL